VQNAEDVCSVRNLGGFSLSFNAHIDEGLKEDPSKQGVIKNQSITYY
jgi:hypothetical protein